MSFLFGSSYFNSSFDFDLTLVGSIACLDSIPLPSTFAKMFYVLTQNLDFSSSDIDECREQPGICQNGACRNLGGTYICDCNSGYERSDDGKKCEGKKR